MEGTYRGRRADGDEAATQIAKLERAGAWTKIAVEMGLVSPLQGVRRASGGAVPEGARRRGPKGRREAPGRSRHERGSSRTRLAQSAIPSTLKLKSRPAGRFLRVGPSREPAPRPR